MSSGDLIVLAALIGMCLACIPTTPSPPKCCPDLNLSLKPRVDPVGEYAGLDQCSILTLHNNNPCPSSGNAVCQIAPLSDGTTAYIQLLRGTSVVFADRAAQQVDVFVICKNGNWVYNGQLFDSISCSQS